MKQYIVGTCCLLMIIAGRDVSAMENTLIIWSHWGTQQVNVHFMQAVTEKFTQKYGIEVKIVWIPKNELREKLVFALDTPEPDISYIDLEFTHSRIGRSLLDLSVLQLDDQLNPSWKPGSIGEYSNIFFPIEGYSEAIYYNKELFAEAGIQLPQNRQITSQEFLEIVRKLRVAGITPIGEGTADRDWKLGLPIIKTIFTYAGPEKMTQLFQGKINFSDPDIVNALIFWKQVIDAQSYNIEKALQLGLSDGIFEVTDGKAGMNFCGTWIYSKFGATDRDNGQIGVLDWFTVDEGKGNSYYPLIWGAGFGINSNSARLADAKKFIEFLMTPTAASLWMQHVQGPYPVNAQNVSEHSLYGTLALNRQHQQPIIQSFTRQLFQENALQQMWLYEVEKFMTGEHTIEQFIERMNSRIE